MKKIIICIALTGLLFACSKTEAPSTEELNQGNEMTLKGKPGGGGSGITVTTNWALGNSAIQSSMWGTLAGGNNSIQRGFCCNTSPAPTISNNMVMSGSGNGDFWGVITGLTPGTTYYARAFALKGNGTVYYGNEKSFTTLTFGQPSAGVGIVTDIDGNEYNTVTYGTQVWMVENLQVTHYRDGTPIPQITDNGAWVADTYGAYCIYENNPANKAVYGLLYNKFAVLNTHNIAPAGWHVPTYGELLSLFYYVGGYQIAGRRMKETGFDHWQTPNTGADNSALFYAVGAGRRDTYGAFSELQQRNYFWTGDIPYDAFYLMYDSESFNVDCCEINTAPYGYSVRCVKD